MPAREWTTRGIVPSHDLPRTYKILLFICFYLQLVPVASISESRLASLRQDTSFLFYHGFDGYMKYAFPEDELRPISCDAFTRDFEDQNHWELNDPLGDYSLTLIDSLSTLAILSSSSQSTSERQRALKRFQEGVQTVIELYGDGNEGPSGAGQRANGFDIDSKVQVFETAIRGLGGLLSAHLFAIGELPIRDYDPKKLSEKRSGTENCIKWTRRFSYDGQLLRLAYDLGRRLLPAFSTQTGIPYPRVNLRHGIPFYRNAFPNSDIDSDEHAYGYTGQCPATPQSDDERTETCSAGAGSLVLEFTTLSRLTGDDRFEKLGKKAFWAVFDRRMPTGLVGSGLDAETGEWKGAPSTGIGAGIDSFYEYAIKSYVLLSGTEPFPPSTVNATLLQNFEPTPLDPAQEHADSFLDAWERSQRAIRRHVYRSENAVHPHYTQVNLYNAAQQATWIDSLSAFYSGSLVLAGQVEEAAVTHLLFTALWTRYSGLPERWSTATGDIEHGLPWWPGRPEFIESAYYLYRATEDPWYVHVGEMTLRDIKRRCWTPCGWAGIQDVRTGELNDRMESFFLGETAKYLHLLFDPDHPLNKLDAPWVFSTEGHPLVIPKSKLKVDADVLNTVPLPVQPKLLSPATCPVAPKPLPLTGSNTAARTDIFHAAFLARLHLAPLDSQRESALMAASEGQPGISINDIRSPTNYTFYPWTLPKELIPPKGTCAPIPEVPTFHISFPNPSTLTIHGPNHRTMNGIFMNNLAGIRLSMIQDLVSGKDTMESFRINAINNQPIGRDEQVFMSHDTISSVVTDNDPNFARVRDPVNLQIVFDIPKPARASATRTSNTSFVHEETDAVLSDITNVGSEEQEALIAALAQQVNTREGAIASAIRFLAQRITMNLAPTVTPRPEPPFFSRLYASAVIASGAGAAPLPNVDEAPALDVNTGQPSGTLIWTQVYGAGQLCKRLLPESIVQRYEIIVIERGGCSFSEKLENIPSFSPNSRSLQLVVLVNSDIPEEETEFSHVDSPRAEYNSPEYSEYVTFRPILDKQQRTPSGLLRRHQIPMVMVEGGRDMYSSLTRATALGIKRRYTVQAQGVPINNVHVV